MTYNDQTESISSIRRQVSEQRDEKEYDADDAYDDGWGEEQWRHIRRVTGGTKSQNPWVYQVRASQRH